MVGGFRAVCGTRELLVTKVSWGKVFHAARAAMCTCDAGRAL